MINKRIYLPTLVLLLVLIIIGSASANPMQVASGVQQSEGQQTPHLIPNGPNNEQSSTTNNYATTDTSLTTNSFNDYGTNIVPNPSLETVSTSNKALPQSWVKNNYGSKATFTYLTTGFTGSKSIKVQSTTNKNVNAYWRFEPQAVTGGEQYEFSVNYQSDTNPEVDAEILLKNGQTTWLFVGTLTPSTTVNKFSARVVLPKDAVKATVYVGLLSKGYLITDDYNLAIATPHTPLNRALVSITIDESASTVYKYGYPIFKKYNTVGTFYILSSDLNKKGMMTKKQFTDFRNLGFEIGSHTVTHPYLNQITTTQLDSELKNSQTAISSYFSGMPVTDFSSPYGVYNDQVISYIKKYYQSHRSTDNDYNGRDNFDPYKINAFSIESQMDANYAKAIIDKAIKDKTWVVLVYHDIRPDDGSGFEWTTTPQNMESILTYLKQNNVATVTTSQALSEIKAQIEPAPQVPRG